VLLVVFELACVGEVNECHTDTDTTLVDHVGVRMIAEFCEQVCSIGVGDWWWVIVILVMVCD
jgi:hypothetical protein